MTPQFAAYVAPARPRARLWQTACGFLVIMCVYAGGLAAMAWAIRLVSAGDPVAEGLSRIDEGADPATLLVLLFTFGFAWAGVWVAARMVHRRGWRSLFGHPPRVLADFVLGLSAMLVVGGGLGLLALPWLPALEPALALDAWLVLLPVALVALLIQTGAEELVFRAYLQQQLAARFASPLIWMGVPSALFGMAHYAPDQGAVTTWLLVAATGLFGLIAADLTARTGALGLAWGLHFANNVLAILVISSMPGLDGMALYRLAEGVGDVLVPLLIFDMALMAAVWAACRAWLARR